MIKIRKLPEPVEGGRVETGVTQFGDDWPGIFIRGDNCFWFAEGIRQVLGVDFDNIILRSNLEGLLNILQSSDVRTHDKDSNT